MGGPHRGRHAVPRARLPRLPEGGQDPRAAYVATWIAHDQRGNLQMSCGQRLDGPREAPARPRGGGTRARLLGSAEEPCRAQRAQPPGVLPAGQAGRGAGPPLRRPQPRDPRPPAAGKRAHRPGRGRRGEAPPRRGQRSRARRRARPVLDADRLLQHDRRVPGRRRLRERGPVDRPGQRLLRRERDVKPSPACAASTTPRS